MKPPGNGPGVLLHTPDGKLTGLSQDTSLREFTQPCTHPVTRSERFPGGMPHYSHEVCVACGGHLRWHPKPQNVERRKLIAAYLARLAMCSTISSWERTFIRSVSEQRKLSPKQLAIIDRIASQHLEAVS